MTKELAEFILINASNLLAIRIVRPGAVTEAYAFLSRDKPPEKPQQEAS